MMKKLLLSILLYLLFTLNVFSQKKPDKDCPPGFSLVLIEKNWKCVDMKPLPVTLINFKAHSAGAEVLLEWSVATELNHSHYEIEHSSDGLIFSTVGATREYHFTHIPDYSLNYYRLVSVDLDGTRNLYKIISINILRQGYDVYGIDGSFLGNFTWNQIPKNRTVIIGHRKYLIK